MRLAVISDIHGNLPALETVLADIGRRGAVDAIVNLGDCVTSPLWPRETMELLDTLHFPTVRGNHDRWIVNAPPDKMSPIIEFSRNELTDAQRTALGALPQTLRLDDDILLLHGTPQSDTTYLTEEKIGERVVPLTGEAIAERLGSETAALVLCGHSHTQRVAMVTGGTIVLNPGSVGEPRSAEPDAEATSPHARYAIATQRAGQWSIELFALAYDWAGIVERATNTGHEQYAAGFRV
jgi:putative phosphoesterase